MEGAEKPNSFISELISGARHLKVIDPIFFKGLFAALCRSRQAKFLVVSKTILPTLVWVKLNSM